MKENFDFIDNQRLRNEIKNAYEVMIDTDLDLVRYMSSLSLQEIKFMCDSEQFSSEIHIILNYSKISKKYTEFILYSLYSICWDGFQNWTKMYIKNKKSININ